MFCSNVPMIKISANVFDRFAVYHQLQILNSSQQTECLSITECCFNDTLLLLLLKTMSVFVSFVS